MARAYSPAGISSFFEIVDHEPNGVPISDPLKIGARGGGFVISRGVQTEVRVERRRRDQIIVSLNGQIRADAKVSETVVRSLLEKGKIHARVTIRHHVEPPIGCGCGTSGAGALSTALAMCDALDLDMTYNQIGQSAHAAEIACQTGLGTVAPLMLGGNVITVHPGAPGNCVIDRIPLQPGHQIVMGWFGPISKPAVLSDQKLRIRINEHGRNALESILKKPTPENFLTTCRGFAQNIGFMTERLQRLLSAMESNGAIGATQNMLGEAAHALVEEGEAKKVYKAARTLLSKEQILLTAIEPSGARLT
ncbi:MAG: hypothetical protein V1857_05080 [archaeon]